jgi:ERCC4-type nuclease
LIDSREQSALDFPSSEHLEWTQIVKLDVGDYGCVYKDNTLPPVVFERKSLADLFGTMGKGYPRFKRELARAKESKVQVVLVIEGSLKDILKGYKHSKLRGISVLRKIITLRIRYGLEHHFFNSREDMSKYIVEYFERMGLELLAKRRG